MSLGSPRYQGVGIILYLLYLLCHGHSAWQKQLKGGKTSVRFVSEGSVHNAGEGTCHVMTVAVCGGDCAHPGRPGGGERGPQWPTSTS